MNVGALVRECVSALISVSAGVVDPIPIQMKENQLGLGKAEEYEQACKEATKTRKGIYISCHKRVVLP